MSCLTQHPKQGGLWGWCWGQATQPTACTQSRGVCAHVGLVLGSGNPPSSLHPKQHLVVAAAHCATAP